MPRRIRIFVPGGIYHVYCRVARGEYVFDEPAEIDRWIDNVAYIARLHDLKILAWCLMSNHYHLVVLTGEMHLWRAMARLQGRFSREFNRRRKLLGRLWQSRYKARLVSEEEYLKHVIAYTHLNPVAAEVVKDPLDYACSGHGELLGCNQPVLCDINAALACFAMDNKVARQLYLERLRAVAEARWLHAGVCHLPWWKAAADDEETLSPEQAPVDACDFSGQPIISSEKSSLDLPAVLGVFECEMELVPGQLSSSSRTRILCWYRCLFVTLAVSWLGHQRKAVACVLKKDPASVSRWLSEGLELQRSEPSFRSRLDHIALRIEQEEVRNAS